MSFDSSGVPPLAIHEYAFAHQETFCALVNSASASIQGVRSQQAVVRSFGKNGPTPQTSEIRAIIPLPVLPSCMDYLFAARVHAFCDQIFEDLPGVFVGALCKTQINDISFSLQITVERFLENRSTGCIGQADIRAFFDSLPAGMLVQDMIRRGLDPATGYGLLRFNACLPLVFKFANQAKTLDYRTSGALTGTRIAGALSRYVISAVTATLHPRINSLCYSAGSVPLS